MMKKRKVVSSGGSGGLVIEASNRKARRKEQRNSKKMKKHNKQPQSEPVVDITKPAKKKHKSKDVNNDGASKRVKFSSVVDEKIISIKNKPSIRTSLLKKSSRDKKEDDIPQKHKSPSFNTSTTHYGDLDDETAAALRRDDMEIEYLESSLGIRKSGKRGGNRELNREYAKNEGYGDDFGDFLMGLDSLVERVVGDDADEKVEDDDMESDASDESAHQSSDESDGESDSAPYESINDEEITRQKYKVTSSDDESYESDDQDQTSSSGIDDADLYADLDDETALAFRNDDAEIAALESKLGLGDKNAKKKLNKEFAKSFCGYGEDFGDFLDDLDSLAHRVGIGKKGIDDEEEADYEESDEDSHAQSSDRDTDDGEQLDDESDNDDSDSDTSIAVKNNADHDAALTYQPTSGEDIYGNKIDNGNNNTAKPTKYVPPHLRKKMDQESGKDTAEDNNIKSVVEAADPETLRLIQRSLNNSLNRLSENTLESVSKSLASLYSQYPFHDMNNCIWRNIQSACIPPAMVMKGLIPLYIAAVAGVHWIAGDRIQLGGCLIEWSVKQFYESLTKGRCRKGDSDVEGNEFVNKEASNTILIISYLYNYGVMHCTLMYDLIKHLIKNFSEIDVESLLLILSHCGQQLRSDDPSALKEIIMMVKERAQKDSDSTTEEVGQTRADSSRIEFMLLTITELKNNKPRKQDVAIREKTNVFKKCIGRMKSSANSGLLAKSTGTCLRISLQDILDAETKGRWWVMGASWAGNQKFIGDDTSDYDRKDSHVQSVEHDAKPKKDTDEEKLLALASSQRMNTDTRRSIFCIVMTSSDCNDAFVKLSRAELLKPKNERDVIRVLVHCCGEEKSFNPFYAHLIMRVCEYQPKSKFTLMLSFWDIFKQLETFSDRKTANLAKLLAKMLSGTNEKYLTIGALKRIEFSPTNMPTQVVLFLSIVMSSLFESANDKEIQEIFDNGPHNNKQVKKNIRRRHRDVFDSDDEDKFNDQSLAKKEDLSELKESISTFLLQFVKSSPKNIQGSKWNENFSIAIESCKSGK